MTDYEVLLTYAESGMRVAESARKTHYSRKVFRGKLISAGINLDINPFDFFELATYLMERKEDYD